jgi:hypothetical protein
MAMMGCDGWHKQTRAGGNAAVDVNFDGNDGMTLISTGQDVIGVIRDSYLLGRLWVKGSRN